MSTRSLCMLSLLGWLLSACGDAELPARTSAPVPAGPSSSASVAAPPVERPPEVDLERHLDRLEREITAP